MDDAFLSIDNMVRVLEGLGGGYLLAGAVHLVFAWIIAQEGRGILMKQDVMSRAFYIQLGLSWMVAAAAGALLTLRVFQQGTLAWLMLGALCVMLCATVMRTQNKARNQQTLMDSMLLLLCIMVGCVAAAGVHMVYTG